MKRRKFLYFMAAGMLAGFRNAAYGALSFTRPGTGKSGPAGIAGDPEDAGGNTPNPSWIDNRDITPAVLPDSEVLMEGTAPDWVKTLIMAEVRIETATPEGTFDSAIRVLDHYAEMGVNGLWICPIYDRDNIRENRIMNGYGNFGPQTIWPKLTGSKDFAESLLVVKRFVDEAHRRKIRILLDIIVWGTPKDAPLVASHPEFYERKAGAFVEGWGGYRFDWSSDTFREWFKNAAVHLIESTGADGFRVDTAPVVSGYHFEEIRNELYSRGRKAVIFSELPNTRRDVFDFEEGSVTGWTEEPDWNDPAGLKKQERKFDCSNLAAGGRKQDFLFRHNIVDMVREGRGIGSGTMQQEGKGGTFRFYTNNLLCHDDAAPFARGNRVRFAYATIFAPFISMWWIGEEWNNPKVTKAAKVMYVNPIEWAEIAPNRAFYEDVKRYIRIRRSYPEIFEYFAASTRDANIAKLDTAENGAPNPLQAYARFVKGKAILVVPNLKDARARFEIVPDYTAMGMNSSSRKTVRNLMTGEERAHEPFSRQRHGSFRVEVGANELGLYLVSEN